MIHINKLWCVLIILFFLFACEKKTESSNEMQTNISEVESFIEIQEEPNMEKPEINTNDIITQDTTFVIIDPVEIILKRPQSIFSRTEYVDRNITELQFFKTSAETIEGLGQLIYLETIVFNNVSDIADFSFLAEVPTLKKIFISYFTNDINWDFLEALPNLEVLHVEEFFFQPSVRIDLKNNQSLEYIGFQYSHLEFFPFLTYIPETLQYLNLQGNRITALPENFNYFRHINIYMRGNRSLEYSYLPDNVILETGRFDEKYQLPASIFTISDVNN